MKRHKAYIILSLSKILSDPVSVLFEGQVRATLTGPDGAVPIDVLSRGDSMYTIGFTPRVEGNIFIL